jgi:hypothetical protein
MPLSRRGFLLWSFAAGLIGRSRHILAALVSPTLPDNQLLDGTQSRCLQIWLDTLLPADAFSPAASELGVHARVADKALGNPDYQKLLSAGCRWLNRQARQRAKQAFVDLGTADREHIVQEAERAAMTSLPRLFFEHTREDAFLFYYAQPATWAMLDYQGPPQPRGFMDYTRTPSG